MDFMKWIRRTLKTKKRRNVPAEAQMSSTLPSLKTTDKSSLASYPQTSLITALGRTCRSTSLGRDNSHIIRVLPPIPQQKLPLHWLDLDLVSQTLSVEHVYEEIFDFRLYSNIVNQLKEPIMNESSQLPSVQRTKSFNRDLSTNQRVNVGQNSLTTLSVS